MPYFTGGSTLGIPGGHPPKLVQMYQPLGDGLVMVSPKIIPCLIVPQCWPNPVLFSLDIPGHTPHSSDCYIVSTSNWLRNHGASANTASHLRNEG